MGLSLCLHVYIAVLWFFIYSRARRRLLCIWSSALIPVGYLLCFTVPGDGARGGCSADTFWMMISIWDSQQRYCCRAEMKRFVYYLHLSCVCSDPHPVSLHTGCTTHPPNEKITYVSHLPGAQCDLTRFYWKHIPPFFLNKRWFPRKFFYWKIICF